MRILYYVSISLFFSAFVHAGEAPLRRVRFAEAKSVKEISGLPPKIEMTVELACNEQVMKAVREEFKEKNSDTTTIAIGAFVQEIPYSSCAGEKKDVKVMAGNSFSGRQYEITRIKTAQ